MTVNTNSFASGLIGGGLLVVGFLTYSALTAKVEPALAPSTPVVISTPTPNTSPKPIVIRLVQPKASPSFTVPALAPVKPEAPQVKVLPSPSPSPSVKPLAVFKPVVKQPALDTSVLSTEVPKLNLEEIETSCTASSFTHNTGMQPCN